MVEVVTVQDKNGKLIEGLTERDFVVTENGQPQVIALCEFQKLSEAAAALQPGLSTRATQADVSKAEPVTRSQITPEAAGDSRFRDRRLLTLYFDMTAMQVPDQLRALTAGDKFIRNQMTSADVVAIMEFSSGAVKVLQDFTADRDLLLLAIAKLVATSQGLDENSADASAADTGAAFGQDDAEFNIFNTDRQLSALQTAVGMLGTLKEKKALVYFAGGLNLNGVDNQAQLRATLNAAIRANVSFYPIDARGLEAGAPMGDATRGSPGGAGMYSGGAALAVSSRFQHSQDTLYTLASDTGGKAMFDYNDLSLGIVQAQKAITSYYIIGYHSSNTSLDGKFRRVKISLREIEGAKLDYRQGYFAGKEFTKFTSADKERQLEEALMLGDPITDLTIAMEVNYFQLNRAEYYVPVVMKIPGSELALARRGGAERTVIDFIGEIKDEYGTTIQNIRDKVDIKLSGETAAQLAKRPIETVPLKLSIDLNKLAPGRYNCQVTVLDPGGSKAAFWQAPIVLVP